MTHCSAPQQKVRPDLAGSARAMVLAVRSDDPAVQLEATTQFRKLLSIGGEIWVIHSVALDKLDCILSLGIVFLCTWKELDHSSSVLLSCCYLEALGDLLTRLDQNASAICGYLETRISADTYTLQVDEKSDVYSFGVVLLELLTGRRPAEPEYGEGSSIVDWVRRKVAGGGEAGWADQSGEARDEMALTLRVALLCTSRSPQERPSMRDVVSMLQEAKRNRKPAAAAKKETHKTN
ncbi:hypothetical protein EJB05_09826, partial [Eragrostis curvula]